MSADQPLNRNKNQLQWLLLALDIRRMTDALIRLVEDGTEFTAEEKEMIESFKEAVLDRRI